MSHDVKNIKKFNPEMIVLHPEGLVVRPGQLIAVCSECRERLQFYGFGNGVGTWTCGCYYDSRETL